MAKPEVLLFDVNETLLDLAGLGPGFARIFGSSEPMSEWFARLLHGSLVANHTNRYRPFGQIGAEQLTALAQRRGLQIGTEQVAETLAPLRSLPPHPEVAGSLADLSTIGFRMVTLTNNPAEAVGQQLAHAGLEQYFERSLSVEAVSRFKPAPEVYLHAAAVLGVEVDQCLMVAAHDWDIIGARSVGMPGAFIARPGAIWGLPDPPPALVAQDLAVLAEELSSS